MSGNSKNTLLGKGFLIIFLLRCKATRKKNSTIFCIHWTNNIFLVNGIAEAWSTFDLYNLIRKINREFSTDPAGFYALKCLKDKRPRINIVQVVPNFMPTDMFLFNITLLNRKPIHDLCRASSRDSIELFSESKTTRIHTHTCAQY